MTDTVPETDISLRRHPLAHCEICPLNNETTVFVPSENAEKQVRVAVCGEAPGYQDCVLGRPFVGPSGKLLDIVLQHNNLKRGDVLYTNTCLCRPKDNATPPKAAVTACQPRLVSELENSGAEVVIALGGSAAESLLPGQGNITKLRVGPPKKSPYLETAKVIPTWHPAYCLRSAEAFPSMTTDIGKINELATPAWEPPEWRAYEDADEALQVIEALEDYNDLVIDIECGIEKDVSFDHPNRYQMLCVGIAYAKRRAVVIGEQAYKDLRVRDALRSLFQRKRLIAHNGKFDLAGLYPTLGPLELYFDTMLASYVLDSRTGTALHGLEVLSVEKLGTPNWKNEILQYLGTGKNYANIPRPILYRYNAYDISCTWDLFEMFQEKLSTECPNWPYPDNTPRSARDVHDFLVRASNQLQYLELNGITVDKAYNRQLTIDYQAVLDEREKNLSDIIGRDINPRSPKQVKEYLLSEGLNVTTTNKEALKNLQERIEPTSAAGMFIIELLEQRAEQKLFSTYVKGYTERLYGGRVFTTYKLIGTTSGRLASANPNLQNVVRNKAIKRQFVVSRPGNIFVHADYKQVEGRVITWLAKDEYLRSIFADPDRDLFDELGSQLYRIPVPQLSKTQRVRTKAFFYGISYGREAYSIGLEHKMPTHEAKRLYSDFFDLIPATAKWQQKVQQQVLNGLPLMTPFGRQRHFYLITKQNRKDVLNEALSFLPQSTASDVCLSALIRLRPMLRGKGFIRLTIHDALVVETSEELRDEVTETMSRVMIEEGAKLTNYVPFEVDVSFGTDWGSL